MSAIFARLKQQIERQSLATRLALSMLLVAALTVAVQLFDLSRQNRAEIEALQTNTLVNEAETLAQQLDGLIRSELSRIVNLSLSRAAQEFISVRPDQRSPLFTPTLADFTNFLASNEFYQAVLLLDQAGEVLISTNGSYVGQNFSNSPFFQEALAGQPFMSNPGISGRSRQPIIWLSAPVYRTGSDSLAGVVAVTVSPEELWRTVELHRVGQNGYAVLLDEYGIRLAHGRDRRYIFRSLMPLPAPVWADLQATGRFGPLDHVQDTGSQALWEYVSSSPRPALAIRPLDEQAEQVYYSAAPLQSRDWTVVAMLPEAEILAPASRVTLRGLLASLALFLFLAITVVWMANRIVRPVPQLVRAAGKIAQGDLSTPVSVQAGSELGELADNFEIMRQRLEDSHRQLETWARELERRVAQRSQELTALSEVVAFASRSQSRAELLNTALNLALRVMDADMGGIWIASDDDTLRLTARHGFNHALSAELTTFAPDEGLLGRVQTSGTPVALQDISQAPLLARAVVREHALHAFAAVPLRIHGRNLGVLGVFRRTDQSFNREVVSLAASIAQQIALTLDNMNLVEQVQTQAHSVARLQERERIAAEIHDSMAQTHGYIYLQADSLADEAGTLPRPEIKRRIVTLRDIIARLSQETRQFIAQLRDVPPPPPARLDETLFKEIERLKSELTLTVDVELLQAGDVVVSEGTSAELARIVGEALRNAQRHGQAEQVRVEFQPRNGTACLRILDDGVGFDPNRLPQDGRRHFGLSVMKARANRIGGTLTIDSQAGQGTQVEVSWPIE